MLLNVNKGKKNLEGLLELDKVYEQGSLRGAKNGRS